ncbi:MAG: hypothetical protein V4640_10345 [Verrucomicrobiota bacterium]
MKIPFLLLTLVSSTFADTTAPSKPIALGIAKVEPKPTTARKSVVLHDGIHWTIVPTKAVLFLPEAMLEKVDAKPVGKLLPWSEFLAKNASWITTDEVTFDQAAGNQVVPSSQTAAWRSQEKLVIAVHHNGPVPVSIGKDLQAITQR